MLLALLAIGNGLVLAGLSVFDSTLLARLDSSIGELKFRDLLGLICSGAAAPVVGYAVDRFGARPVITVGLLLIGAGLLLYPHVGALWHVYGIHVLLGVAFASTNIVVIIVLLTQWFRERRGLALGIVLSGTSIGGVIFPPLAVMLIERLGWQDAFRALALIPLAFIPLMLLVVRERREGMTAPAATTGQRPSVADPRLWLTMVKTREFLLLTIVAVAVFYSANTFIRHSFLFLRLNGADAAVAAAGISTVYFFGLIGKLAAGSALEVLRLRWVFATAQTASLIGTLTLILFGPLHATVGLALIGLGWGAGYTLMQLSAASYFAGPGLGRLIGGFVIIESLAQGMGSFFTGVLHDVTGNYNIPFLFCAVLMTAAIFVTLTSRAFKA